MVDIIRKTIDLKLFSALFCCLFAIFIILQFEIGVCSQWVRYSMFTYYFLLSVSLVANIMSDITSIHELNEANNVAFARDTKYATPVLNRIFEVSFTLSVFTLQLFVGLILQINVAILTIITTGLVLILVFIFIKKTASPF